MELLLPSFLAGILTILAPCVFAVLPVILTGSISSEKNRLKPIRIVISLSISIIIFTLLLKVATIFINIPNSFWRYFSGSIITFLAITMIFPNSWNKIAFKLKLYKTEELIENNKNKQGSLGDILLGASLGPVFTSCSPTYLFIIATVIPQDFTIGLLNLIIYTTGLAIPLLIIAYGGQSIINKFKFAANPNGKFKKTIGIVLLLVGLIISLGIDKKIENQLIKAGFTGASDFEQKLIDNSQQK